MIALARRVGISCRSELFDEIARRTPVIANVRPAGAPLRGTIPRAGGLRRCSTSSGAAPPGRANRLGASLGERIAGGARVRPGRDPPLAEPLKPAGGLAVLRGSLAPQGALVKTSAASPSCSPTAAVPSSSTASTT
ncbi:MAG: dihydroxy-acid dehydratase [Thermoleophilia bacterium]